MEPMQEDARAIKGKTPGEHCDDEGGRDDSPAQKNAPARLDLFTWHRGSLHHVIDRGNDAISARLARIGLGRRSRSQWTFPAPRILWMMLSWTKA